MRSFIPFAIVFASFASPLFAGCASPVADQTSVGGQGEAFSKNPPSPECGAVARKAALALEQINGDRSRVNQADLVDSHSDRELVRIGIDRSGQSRAKKDSYIVNTESQGGSPCFAYGLQVKSEQMDLADDGAVVAGGPSAECADVAKKAVQAIGSANDQRVTINGTELAASHSDKELVRVKIQNEGGESDSYLVSTESLGGSPCLVYGLQLKSQETDLVDAAP